MRRFADADADGYRADVSVGFGDIFERAQWAARRCTRRASKPAIRRRAWKR